MHDISPTITKSYEADLIIYIVCNHFNLTASETIKKTRVENIRSVRQLSMYFLRRYTAMSLKRIGAIYGQDHTTVVHAVAKIKDLISIGDPVVSDIREIRCSLLEHKIIQE